MFLLNHDNQGCRMPLPNQELSWVKQACQINKNVKYKDIFNSILHTLKAFMQIIHM